MSEIRGVGSFGTRGARAHRSVGSNRLVEKLAPKGTWNGRTKRYDRPRGCSVSYNEMLMVFRHVRTRVSKSYCWLVLGGSFSTMRSCVERGDRPVHRRVDSIRSPEHGSQLSGERTRKELIWKRDLAARTVVIGWLGKKSGKKASGRGHASSEVY